MKKTLLLITALLLASIIDAQDLQQRISDKFRFHPQIHPNNFVNDGMVKMDTMQGLLNSGGEFIENERTHFEYNGQGQVRTVTYYGLDEFDVIGPQSRERYFYVNGYMSYDLNEYFNQEADMWVLEDSVTYTYEGGLLVREDYFWHDVVNGEMGHDEITYYYYTGTQLDSVITNRWNGADFFPFERETYQYDAGEIVLLIYSEVDGSGLWYDVEKYTYIWQGGQLQEMMLQSFVAEVGSLVNDQKSVYAWKDNGNLNEMLHYGWSVEENDWIPMMRQYGVYNNDVTFDQMVLPFFADEEGNPLIYFAHQIDSVYMDMHAVESGWSEYGVYKFHYSAFVGIDETSNANNTALEVYPNPVKDRLNVNYLFERQTSALICDNLGRVIKNVVLQGVDGIDISELNSGFYYLVLTGDEHSGRMAKFIVE